MKINSLNKPNITGIGWENSNQGRMYYRIGGVQYLTMEPMDIPEVKKIQKLIANRRFKDFIDKAQKYQPMNIDRIDRFIELYRRLQKTPAELREPVIELLIKTGLKEHEIEELSRRALELTPYDLDYIRDHYAH